MIDVIEGLMTKPINAFIGVIILWGILHLLFVTIIKISEIAWIRLEYIWIFVGLIGLMTLVDESRRIRSNTELEFLQGVVYSRLKTLSDYSSWPIHCVKYKYNSDGYLSREEFNKRQAEEDRLCAWMSQIGEIAQNAILNKGRKLDVMPVFNRGTSYYDFEYVYVKRIYNKINEGIKKCNELKLRVNNHFWHEMKLTFGILLMIIAFAVRLTIVSKKINDRKSIKQADSSGYE